jgi:predicted permease
MGWLQRVINVFRGRDLNADIDEELQFHIDERIAENVAAGMTQAEARRAALARFGSRGGARERTRDANVLVAFERFCQDLRHGARMFARTPALTAICVLSIAFGTGANVAMFSMVDTLLLRPLPVPRASGVVTVGARIRRGSFFRTAESYPNFLDLRERTQSFEGLGGYAYDTVAVATRPGETARVRLGAFVTGDFFSVLGVVPELGRGFLPEEDGKTGRGAPVVLSDAFWRGSLAADSAVLGRKLQIAGREFTVIGVMPASFTGVEPYIQDSVFLPIGMLPHVATTGLKDDILDARDARVLTIKGRLRAGVSMEDARAELATIGRDLERAYPDADTGASLVVQSEFQYKYERRPLDSALAVILTVLSIAVLCVACANVAGLLTSRAPVRAREMSLRIALGAGRGRLIRQLVTECLLVAAAGGVGGLAVGRAGIALLHQIRLTSEIVTMPAFAMDQRTLTFSLAIAMATAFLVGLGPAVATTRVDLAGSLKISERGSASGRLTARAVLVGVQVALSLVLLTLTIFAVQVFHRILDRGPGFRTANIAKITVDPGQTGRHGAEAARFFERVLDDARAVPGVRSASIISVMPLANFELVPAIREDEHLARGEQPPTIWGTSIGESFFETLETPLFAGRLFGRSDTAAARPVAIINDTLARRFWPDQNPLGKRLHVLGRDEALVEVIGVVATTTVGYPGELPTNAIYFPYRQRPADQMVLLAATAGESAAVLKPLQDAIRGIDRAVPVFDAQPIEAFYGERVTGFGTVMLRLVGGMGVMGILLTMVGLYGLVSYSVSRRTREIGIRIAVGATYARILTMVLRQGMTPTLAGVVAGLALGVVTTRWMNQLVPFSHHVDAGAYYVAVPLLVAVALGAAFLPARRAARVSPTEALRCD